MGEISLVEVSHSYGVGASHRQVLRDINLRLTEARIGVIGANGSGKSTFARLLNGLVLPSQGYVKVNGVRTDRNVKAVRRQVGFCFSDPDAQIVMPTVAEDIEYGLRPQGLPLQQRQARTAAALQQYGLTEYADQPAHLLSGGQKQLLALAAVMVTQPAIVVLDEPTTRLDLPNTRRIARMIGGLAAQVIMVTHDLELLTEFERVLVFHAGRIIFDGAPAPAVAAYLASVEVS